MADYEWWSAAYRAGYRERRHLIAAAMAAGMTRLDATTYAYQATVWARAASRACRFEEILFMPEPVDEEGLLIYVVPRSERRRRRWRRVADG